MVLSMASPWDQYITEYSNFMALNSRDFKFVPILHTIVNIYCKKINFKKYKTNKQVSQSASISIKGQGLLNVIRTYIFPLFKCELLH